MGAEKEIDKPVRNKGPASATTIRVRAAAATRSTAALVEHVLYNWKRISRATEIIRQAFLSNRIPKLFLQLFQLLARKPHRLYDFIVRPYLSA